MNAIQYIDQKQIKKKVPSFKAGDTVRVHVKIKEGDKERIQIFEGTIIKIHRSGAGSSFTVRKISYGVGVERIFPIHSPVVHKIEVAKSGKVRRAKLYYLRELAGKKARITTQEKERDIVTSTPETNEQAGGKDIQTETKAEESAPGTEG